MKSHFKLCCAVLGLSLSTMIYAQDISGMWQQVDDKTGQGKGHIEIKKESDGSFSGTINKLTPEPGVKPNLYCLKCPAPYTGKAVEGLKIITGLQHIKDDDYDKGKVLDPVSGKTYSLKAKIMQNGRKLRLRGYLGATALVGRSQTWIRIE